MTEKNVVQKLVGKDNAFGDEVKESQASSVHIQHICNAKASDLVDVYDTPIEGQWVANVKLAPEDYPTQMDFFPVVIVADTKEQAERKAASMLHDLMAKLITYWGTLDVDVPTGTEI